MAAKNAGKRLLELQSHDLCNWLHELRDMILGNVQMSNLHNVELINT